MKLILQKWGAKWCPGCNDLAKARTLEKFARAHPDVKVEVHDDTNAGSASWSERADLVKVKELPTLVWLAGGKVLFKSTDVSPEGIERQLKRALKAIG